MSESAALKSGLFEMGLSIAEDKTTKLLAYLELLHKWNKTYNLTAIREKSEMIHHHLLDSLAVLPYLWAGKWLDVGCGGGMPGLILAIMQPDWEFTLLDSNSKKTSFVQQVVIELELKNVSVYCGRVEGWEPNCKFDGIISRAFAELGDFLKLTNHLISENGRWAAMKGQPESELMVMPDLYEVDRVISLKVPGLHAARSLVIAKRKHK